MFDLAELSAERTVQPVDRPIRLASAVVKALRASITEQHYPPESKLPGETVLAQQFGVSRAVIREALAELKGDGLVLSRQGAGAFVAARPGLASFKLPAAVDRAHTPSLAAIFELRRIVECAAAGLAAQRRTAADLQRIAAAQAAVVYAAAHQQDGAMADGAFHVAIADAAHNPALSQLIAYLDHQFGETRGFAWSALGHRQGVPVLATSEHAALLAAITAGDPSAAEAAAAAHLSITEARLIAASQSTPRPPSPTTPTESP